MASNLPPKSISDSASATRLFFDTYGQQVASYPATEVSATIAFFEKKGFDEQSSIVVASILLKQAKYEGVNIFKILDGFNNFNQEKISALVSQVLNLNRVPTSTLGYSSTQNRQVLAKRNIIA